MNYIFNQQRSAAFRVQVEAALEAYQRGGASKFCGPFYLPSDFREPERQQFISIKAGTVDYQTLYPNLASFWVDALFDFLESQLQDGKFEQQIGEARCELVDEMTMYQQVSECFRQLKPNYTPSFIYDGEPADIYRMFDSATRISFALRSTLNYYAFFWESETGISSAHQQ